METKTTEATEPQPAATPMPAPQSTEQKVRSIMEQTGLSEDLVQDFRFATFLAGSTIIPAHYQRSAPNCFIAITTAKMLKIDPFFVMQGTYIFEGKLCWYSKHMQIVFKMKMGTKIQWEWDLADKTNMRCRAYAMVEGERVDGIWISQLMAKESNWKSLLWKSAPELMLTYRAASWFISLRFPEVLGGIGVDSDQEDATPSTSLTIAGKSDPDTRTVDLSDRFAKASNA